MSLRNCFAAGRAEAVDICEQSGIEGYQTLEECEKEELNMLCPNGRTEGRLGDDGADIEDSLEESRAVHNMTAESQTAGTHSEGTESAGDGNLHLELSAEDLAGCLAADEDEASGSKVHGSKNTFYIDIGGRLHHKASLCRAASEDFHVPLSTDRLKRVRAQPRYNSKADNASILDNINANDHDIIQVDDPAVALVCCQSRLFLAVIKICGFYLGSNDSRPPQLPAQIIEDPESDVSVRALVMTLLPQSSSSSDPFDWVWNGQFEDSSRTIFIPGQLVSPIDPEHALNTSDDSNSGWQFNSNDLISYRSFLCERSNSSNIDVPRITKTDTFPYALDGM